MISRRIAWCSPFGTGSGIGFFTRKILPSIVALAEADGSTVTLLVNPNGHVYPDLPCQKVMLAEEDLPRIAAEYDEFIFCIGNNEENHYLIRKLAQLVPGTAIILDFVNQHLIVPDVLDRKQSPEMYHFLMTHLYGMAARYAACEGMRCFQGTGTRVAPWDSHMAASFPLFELSSRGMTGVVTVSRFAAERFARGSAAPVLELQNPCDLKAVPSEADVEAWRQEAIRRRHVNIASFGVIQPGKQIHVVLEAMARLRTPRDRIRYEIVGYPLDARYLDLLREMIAVLRLEDIVTIRLGISDEELLELLRVTDVFVNIRHPNTEAGSGSLIEQLGSGKPVIVLDSGCYNDVPADAAIKLQSLDDIDAIASAIDDLVGDRQKQIDLGRLGRDWAFLLNAADFASRVWQMVSDQRQTSDQFRRFARELRAFPLHTMSAAEVERLSRKRAPLNKARDAQDVLSRLSVADAREGRFVSFSGLDMTWRLVEFRERDVMNAIQDIDLRARSPAVFARLGVAQRAAFIEDVCIGRPLGLAARMLLINLLQRRGFGAAYDMFTALKGIRDFAERLRRGETAETWERFSCYNPDVWLFAIQLDLDCFVAMVAHGLFCSRVEDVQNTQPLRQFMAGPDGPAERAALLGDLLARGQFHSNDMASRKRRALAEALRAWRPQPDRAFDPGIRLHDVDPDNVGGFLAAPGASRAEIAEELVLYIRTHLRLSISDVQASIIRRQITGTSPTWRQFAAEMLRVLHTILAYDSFRSLDLEVVTPVTEARVVSFLLGFGNALFSKGVYVAILGRRWDEAGLAAMIGDLQSGRGRITHLRAMMDCAERRALGLEAVDLGAVFTDSMQSYNHAGLIGVHGRDAAAAAD